MSERSDPNAPATLAPDAKRLSALASYGILDTPAEQGFDDLVQLARTLCAAPVGLVSLVTGDRQWFKANVGFPHCETDLDHSVCKFVLAEPDVMVIPDLAADPRTAGNPLVTGEPFVRFYAGAPLRTDDGQALGSLCVLDHQPRPAGLSAAQADGLRLIARQVMQQLGTRRALAERNTVLAIQDAALRRERRLETLTRGSEALFGSDDPVGALEPILAAEAQALGFDQSYVYTVDAEGRCLSLTHAIGVDEATRAFLRQVSFDVPLCGIVAESGRPLILSEVQASTEPRYQIARDAGISAFASYPIASGGQTRGVISFGSTFQPAYDPEALQFFATIVRMLSLAEERRNARKAQQRLLTSLQRAQEAGGVGLFTVVIRTDTLYPTPEFCRLYGLLVQDSYPASVIEAQVLPEDRGQMSTAAARTQGDAAVEVEYRVRHQDTGAIRWLARTGRIELDADGRPVRFTGTARDITDQRATRQALKDSEERLSLAFEASGTLGWYDWDIPNDRVRSSDSFARIFSVDPARAAVGAPIAEFFAGMHPDDRTRVGGEVEAAMADHAPYDTTYRLLAADGTITWVHALGRVSYDATARPVRFTGIATDVTAFVTSKHRQQALLDLGDQLRDLTTGPAMTKSAAELVGTTLNATRASYGHLDFAEGTVRIEADWTTPGAASVVGVHRLADYGDLMLGLRGGSPVVIEDVCSDARTATDPSLLLAIDARALVNMPVRERGRTVGLFFVHADRPRRWTDDELAFLRTVADRVEVGLARLRAEDQQLLLNREITHRLKNILAMVQAIATQTLRNAPDLDVAREALASRLVALGKGHDILMTGTGESADLATVVEGALAIHDDERKSRLHIEGPPVVCAAQAALSVALMMHELATNAAKYGALSRPDGYVTVTWTFDDTVERPNLTFTWQEHGGPPVVRPARQGFGSKLIVRGLAGAVGGIAKLDYPPEGVICTLTAPVAGFRGEA